MSNGNECANCGKLWDDSDLHEITHGIWERVAPGELMPSGECPECGALCHPVENALTPLRDALEQLLGRVKGLLASNKDTAELWRKVGYEFRQAEKTLARTEGRQ